MLLQNLQKCHKCSEVFQTNDTKHHCRACGEGFCDSCSSKSRPVPERGWGLAPVRVCDACFHNREIPTGKSTVKIMLRAIFCGRGSCIRWAVFFPCSRVAGRCLGGGTGNPDCQEGRRSRSEHVRSCSWCHWYTSRWELQPMKPAFYFLSILSNAFSNGPPQESWRTRLARPTGSPTRTSAPATSANESSRRASPSTTAAPVARECATTAPRSDGPCRPAAGTTRWGSATAATRRPASCSHFREGPMPPFKTGSWWRFVLKTKQKKALI